MFKGAGYQIFNADIKGCPFVKALFWTVVSKSQFEIETQNGLSHGSGTLFTENGEILQKGQWKEDIFVESWESIHQTHLIHNVLEDHFNRNFYVFVVLFRLDIRENKIKSKQQTNFTRNKIAKETWDLIKDSKWRTIKYKIWEELLTSNKLENIEIKNR